MKNNNKAPLWFKSAYKIATAPLRTKLSVGGLALAFAAIAHLDNLQGTTEPTPQATYTLEDNTRLLNAYAAIGKEPPAEIVQQTTEQSAVPNTPHP